MLCEYFTNIFTTTSPTPDHLAAAVADLPTKITWEMESHLDKPFTEEEVVVALTHICPTKAPGLDGLPTVFFQKH